MGQESKGKIGSEREEGKERERGRGTHKAVKRGKREEGREKMRLGKILFW